MLLGAVGGTLTEDVNGVVVSVRNRGHRIGVWTATCDHPELGQMLREIVGPLAATIEFGAIVMFPETFRAPPKLCGPHRKNPQPVAKKKNKRRKQTPTLNYRKKKKERLTCQECSECEKNKKKIKKNKKETTRVRKERQKSTKVGVFFIT